MGIRTLHRRTAPAQANANTEQAPSTVRPPVPPFAAGASIARVPTDLRTALRHTPATLRRLVHRTQGWAGLAAELTRSYVSLVLTLLPRPRPAGTVTVFVATAGGTVTGPPDGSAPYRPYPNCRRPGPDATP